MKWTQDCNAFSIAHFKSVFSILLRSIYGGYYRHTTDLLVKQIKQKFGLVAKCLKPELSILMLQFKTIYYLTSTVLKRRKEWRYLSAWCQAVAGYILIEKFAWFAIANLHLNLSLIINDVHLQNLQSLLATAYEVLYGSGAANIDW